MDISHLTESLRSLSKFMYIRTEDELSLLQEVYHLLGKLKDRIWVLNASLGGLCPLKDYVATHDCCNATISPTKATVRSQFEFFGAFQDLYGHDPGHGENFYIVLDAEVWCADPVAQRWVLDLADQLQLNDDRMIKVFMFVSLTKDPVPEKLAGLFEVIEDVYPLDVFQCAKRMFESLQCEVPSEEDCLNIFKGLTKYQIESAIIRSAVISRSLAQDAARKMPPKASAQMGIITQAVTRLLGFKEESATS